MYMIKDMHYTCNTSKQYLHPQRVHGERGDSVRCSGELRSLGRIPHASDLEPSGAGQDADEIAPSIFLRLLRHIDESARQKERRK
jgi:hypothetical protein